MAIIEQSPNMGTAKEATIQSLSNDVRAGLFQLQNLLDERFARHTKEGGKTEDKPANSNVLDEIIDTLSDSRAHLSTLTDFIHSEVLPKIS